MRPIDADELPKQEIKDEKEYINPSYARGWNDAIRSVYLYAPTIEAKPIRRGRWIDYKSLDWSGGGAWKCSSCGYGYSWAGYHEANEFSYCPNCGARMGE